MKIAITTKIQIAMIGGTSGVAKNVTPHLAEKYDIVSAGSSWIDVSNYESVYRFFTSYNPEVVVYFSGVNYDNLVNKVIEDEMQKIVSVNATGFVNVLRNCQPYMRAGKFGRVIYISSVLSERPIPGAGIYSASKAFSDSIVRTFSVENGKHGITCNSIQLGYFEGGMSDRVPVNIMEAVKNKIPLKRLGTGEELANLLTCIIETPYMNGANIQFDGGYANT